ncbi:hypothetical protein [Pseudonocardia humida]|uniref:Uncharacterized protein n=1 Tax=Pseudonocardia humida TaxID=2800819 RepID=A0ABT0ZUC0_9PSEU|nr:hypothetical protein [Pseudonocardia humida]MCO1654331.1 hypothetical protein [Pseudonocardia humida]
MSDPHQVDDAGSRATTLALLIAADVLLVLTLVVVLSLAVQAKAGVVMLLVVGAATALVVVRHVQFARSGRRARGIARQRG